jgi:type IV pilus assembly protein PilW
MKPMRKSAGFGLVEMMVALALGLLVVGGATVLLLATRQSNGSTDNLSRVQESVRTSYDLMARELREAGATPCDSQLLVANVLNNAQGATPTWWAVWSEPLRGFGGADDFDGVAFGTGTAARVAGTQAVAVRYGAALDNLSVTTHDTAAKTITVNVNNHSSAAGDLLMVCNYKQAAIFQATAANIANGTFVHNNSGSAPGNCSSGLGLPTLCTSGGNAFQFSAGSLVGRYTASGWYIGHNGRTDGGGRSLYRVTPLGAEEVADGVRDMRLRYLQAEGSDYIDAASVTDWSRVLAVRLDLSFEGPDLQASTVANAAAARLTRTVGFTINLRNQQP